MLRPVINIRVVVACCLLGLVQHAIGAEQRAPRGEKGSAPREETAEPDHSVAEPSNSQEKSEVLSPLHALIGIDPVTGEFKPPKSRGGRRTADTDRTVRSDDVDSSEETTDDSAGALADDGSTAAHSGNDPLADRLESLQRAESPEAVLENLEGLLQQSNPELWTQIAQMLPETLRDDPLFQQYLAFTWWIAAVTAAGLVLWAVALVFVELVGWWLQSDDDSWQELDRRYHRIRFRRRMLQAVLILGLAGIVLAGGSSTQWWTDSVRLTLLLAASLVLSVWIWGIGLLIKRSARWYGQRVLRDVRRHQLELQQEVQELRQRVAKMRLTVGV